MTGMTALSIDMNLPALPHIAKVFGSSVVQVQLTLSVFLLGFGVGQLICGPLSDRYGRRRILLIGLVVFTLAGFGCACSLTLATLIVLRFVQGMGASVGRVLSLALVRDNFEHDEATSVLSLMTQVMMIAPLVAPNLGGYMLIWFGWRSIFLVLGLSGAILWLAVWWGIGEPKRPHVNVPTAGLWATARRVISHRQTLLNTLVICFAGGGLFAYLTGSPFVYTDVFHVPKEHFGRYFAVTALCLMVGAGINRARLERNGSQVLLRSGVRILAAAGLALIGLMYARAGLFGVVVPMMAYMFGLGFVTPNATAAAIAPHGNAAGLASSVIGSVQTVGGFVAGCLVGAFYNGTPASLAWVVFVMSILAALTHWAAVRYGAEPPIPEAVELEEEEACATIIE
jgi:MFS transporter, DHA1 family, multidrug resistance protein